jgi:hypothetical protein
VGVPAGSKKGFEPYALWEVKGITDPVDIQERQRLSFAIERNGYYRGLPGQRRLLPAGYLKDQMKRGKNAFGYQSKV